MTASEGPAASGSPNGRPPQMAGGATPTLAVVPPRAKRGWGAVLPPREPTQWLPGAPSRLRGRTVLVVAVVVDGFVVLALAGIGGPLRLPTSLYGSWEVLVAGPVAGLVANLVTAPLRVGIGPRGLVLGFVTGPLLVPWHLVLPGEGGPGSRCELSYVDPRTMRLASLVLPTVLARELLDHAWSRGWDRRAEASRAWGGAAA